MGSKSGQVSETPQERAQAQHALDLMKDYKQRWLPVQQRLAATIEDEGKADSAARRLATGKASTDTAMAFQKSGEQLEKGLSNSGVAPGSSRSNLAVAGLGTDQAASTGLGHMMSEQQVDDAYTQGLGALTSLGRGERASVGTSLTQQAQQSAAQASADAQASLMARQGDAAIGGQVLGFGLQQGMTHFGSGVNGFGSGVNSSTPMNYSGGNLGTPQAGV
jgi:hypothetical protein